MDRRHVKRILVIRLRELGDSLLTTPMIRQLGRLYADAKIDVLCQRTNRLIFEHNPHISEIFELPRKTGMFLRVARQMRGRSYDIVVDPQSLPKTALLTRLTGAPRRIGFRKRWLRNRLCYTHPYRLNQLEYFARSYLKLLQDDRVDLDDVHLDFPVSDADREEARQFRDTWFKSPVAALFGVGKSEGDYRLWPSAKMAELGDRFAEAGFQPFLVYGPGQEAAARNIASQMHCEPIVDYPMPSFCVLKEILSGCDVFVGNDGGPKHLGTVAETPTVTLFHNSHKAVIWNPPQNPRHRIVATECGLSRDLVVGDLADVDQLAEVSVNAVWKQVQALIGDGYIREARFIA